MDKLMAEFDDFYQGTPKLASTEPRMFICTSPKHEEFKQFLLKSIEEVLRDFIEELAEFYEKAEIVDNLKPQSEKEKIINDVFMMIKPPLIRNERNYIIQNAKDNWGIDLTNK